MSVTESHRLRPFSKETLIKGQPAQIECVETWPARPTQVIRGPVTIVGPRGRVVRGRRRSGARSSIVLREHSEITAGHLHLLAAAAGHRAEVSLSPGMGRHRRAAGRRATTTGGTTRSNRECEVRSASPRRKVSSSGNRLRRRVRPRDDRDLQRSARPAGPAVLALRQGLRDRQTAVLTLPPPRAHDRRRTTRTR